MPGSSTKASPRTASLWGWSWAPLVLAHPGSTASHSLAIPGTPALAGLVVGTQALVLDANAASDFGSVTNAGVLRIH